ncbi:MAG: class I SAM-dependent methyltransferase [Actinomycetota bacterium]
MGEAQRRWAEALAGWAIPEDILARAPESPWGFPPALFQARHDVSAADTPSHRRALEALPQGGDVIDVGVGGGAGSLPLARRAARLTGVDESERMLQAFADAADRAGVAHREVQGRWPEVAPAAGTADVVVCHHVLYNSQQIVPFLEALTEAASRTVVVEVTATHPGSTLKRLWRHFHDLERPSGPTYEDALAVLDEMGLRYKVEPWERAPRRRDAPRAELVAFVRRRLCLPAERDPEIDEFLGEDLVWSPGGLVTISWAGEQPVAGTGARAPR